MENHSAGLQGGKNWKAVPFSTTTTNLSADSPEAEKLPQFLDLNEATSHQMCGRTCAQTALQNKDLMYAHRGKA